MEEEEGVEEMEREEVIEYFESKIFQWKKLLAERDAEIVLTKRNLQDANQRNRDLEANLRATTFMLEDEIIIHKQTNKAKKSALLRIATVKKIGDDFWDEFTVLRRAFQELQKSSSSEIKNLKGQLQEYESARNASGSARSGNTASSGTIVEPTITSKRARRHEAGGGRGKERAVFVPDDDSDGY
jgi:hypothetical protein